MIVYDVHTAAFIREAPVITLDSYNQAMKRNADGSGDVYFGPQAPARQGDELDIYRGGKGVFPRHAFLRSRQAALRQDVEVAGHRAVSAQ
jgi:hypothetical protein